MKTFTKADVMELKRLLSEAWAIADHLEGSKMPLLIEMRDRLLGTVTDAKATRQDLAAAIRDVKAVL